MKNLKIKTIIRRVAAAMVACLTLATAAMAEGVSDSTIVTGTTRLLSDLSTALMILCPTVSGVVAIYFAIRRSMADETDGKMWEKRIKIAIICAIGGPLLIGLISLIAGYYN